MDIHLQKNRVFITVLIVLCLTQVNAFKVNCTRDSECTYQYFCCNYKCEPNSCAAGTNTQCVNGDGCEDNLWYGLCCGTSCYPWYSSCPSTGITVVKTNSTATKTNTTTNGTQSNGTSTPASNQTTGQSSGSNQTANSTSGSTNTSNGSTNNTDASESQPNSTVVIPTNGTEESNKSNGSQSSNPNEWVKNQTKFLTWCPTNCINNDGTCLPLSQCLPLCNDDFNCGSLNICCSKWSIEAGIFDNDLKAIFGDQYSQIRSKAETQFYCIDKDVITSINDKIKNILKTYTNKNKGIELECKIPLRMITVICVVGGIAAVIMIILFILLVRFYLRKRRSLNLNNATQVDDKTATTQRGLKQTDSPTGNYDTTGQGPGKTDDQGKDIEVEDKDYLFAE